MIEDQTDTRKWGRIYMDNKVSELDSIEQRRSQAWSEKDQEAYLERVRQKAEDKAREILQAAQEEASAMREAAYNEGYNSGLRQAEDELNELRSSMGDTVQAVLSMIEGQCSGIYQAWQADLCALVRLAVEKGLAITLAEEKAQVLTNLFEQAVQNLESARQLVVKCSPEDAAAVEDIISLAREKFPEMTGWKVRGEASIEPGGILVESESSLANNTIESRRAAVEKILEGLNLALE